MVDPNRDLASAKFRMYRAPSPVHEDPESSDEPIEVDTDIDVKPVVVEVKKAPAKRKPRVKKESPKKPTTTTTPPVPEEPKVSTSTSSSPKKRTTEIYVPDYNHK